MCHAIRCFVGPNGITRNVEPLTFMEDLQSPFHFASARGAAVLVVTAGDTVLGRPMRVDVMGTSSDGERDESDDDEQQSWSGAFEAMSVAVHGSSIWIWIARCSARWKHKPLLSAEEGTTERFWSFRVVLTVQITVVHLPIKRALYGIATGSKRLSLCSKCASLCHLYNEKRLLLSTAEDGGCIGKSPEGHHGSQVGATLVRGALEPSFLLPQAQNVGDQIVHIGGFDHKVRHGRMACARPHGQRCH